MNKIIIRVFTKKVNTLIIILNRICMRKIKNEEKISFI